MSNQKNVLQTTNTYELEEQREKLKLKAADKGLDAVGDALMLLVRLANVAATGWEIDQRLHESRKESEIKINELNAATMIKIDCMIQELKGEKENTKQLEILINLVATKGHTFPEPLLKSIGAAIENCTKKV